MCLKSIWRPACFFAGRATACRLKNTASPVILAQRSQEVALEAMQQTDDEQQSVKEIADASAVQRE